MSKHKSPAPRSSNTSGVEGVYWHPTLKYWLAYIAIGGKRRLLGYHHRFEDAVQARRAGERLKQQLIK